MMLLAWSTVAIAEEKTDALRDHVPTPEAYHPGVKKALDLLEKESADIQKQGAKPGPGDKTRLQFIKAALHYLGLKIVQGDPLSSVKPGVKPNADKPVAPAEINNDLGELLSKLEKVASGKKGKDPVFKQAARSISKAMKQYSGAANALEIVGRALTPSEEAAVVNYRNRVAQLKVARQILLVGMREDLLLQPLPDPVLKLLQADSETSRR